jgi:hypothetical protein
VSENHRFLVTEKGKPFFWLGDTAWELLHRLNREEVIRYLDSRRKQGFTVVQTVGLAEIEGLGDPNALGASALVDGDPSRPAVTPGSDPKDAAQYDYWDHVDYAVDQAALRGIYIALLPTWGRWVNGPGEVFTPENARTYGEFLGKRYGPKNVIWVLGGDRNPDEPRVQAIWRAMAEGIQRGAGGPNAVLMTFHPTGSATSSTWFHDDPWLDLNMQQNGHCTDTDVWNRIGRDYARTPVKPVLDGEPLYEDHPICFDAKERGYSDAYEVRKFAYWDVFAGACGHTYGNHSIWQMHAPSHGGGINGPLNYWYEAIDHPGSKQMQFVRKLIESRPMLRRVPDQALLASDAGTEGEHVQATRASDGSYAFVYLPLGRPVKVHMSRISGKEASASWYDPRTGVTKRIGSYQATGEREFTPPSMGRGHDWVLVLDAVGR